MEEMIKSAQFEILLHPQFEHKQEPAQDQSEGGRPRDGGHSQPHTGDLSHHRFDFYVMLGRG